MYYQFILLSLFNSILLYRINRKDGYHSNTIVEQEKEPVETLFVAETKARRQGKESPGHLLPARSSPSENVGTPWTQGNKIQSPQEHPDKSGWKKLRKKERRLPRKLVDQASKIAWKRTQGSPDHCGTPSKNVIYIESSKGPSRADPSIDWTDRTCLRIYQIQISKVLHYTF